MHAWTKIDMRARPSPCKKWFIFWNGGGVVGSTTTIIRARRDSSILFAEFDQNKIKTEIAGATRRMGRATLEDHKA
jgi:hypothetical protein